MDRRWLFVLPNLFTVSSIFCGIYAITLATGATGDNAQDAFFRAAMAIFFGALFDGFDGRVARLTRTESEFGIQLDSLADVITFGAAPAVVMYEWALEPLGWPGLIVAGVYASCGALRLARFNVMAAKSSSPSEYFTGLPIPFGAGMIVAVIVAATKSVNPQAIGPVAGVVLTLVLSYLMVSTIPYYSFKKFKPKGAGLVVLVAILGGGAAVAVFLRPSFVLVTWGAAYILFGLVADIFRRHKEGRLALAAPRTGAEDAVDDDEDET